jgi:2-polyprenyl-6-methoxyphenol hydroxylase-like FAD-dependent oxidoreductase
VNRCRRWRRLRSRWPSLPKAQRDLAVVVGAGFCGRVLSLVLARYYARVVLLEKQDSAQAAWQSSHAHLLSRQGLQLLATLLPRLEWDGDEGVQSRLLRLNDDVVWQGPHLKRLSTQPSGVGPLRFFRRDRVDHWLAERIAACPNIEWHFSTTSMAILGHPRRVDCRSTWQGEAMERSLNADAVFVTGGRHIANEHLFRSVGAKWQVQRVPSKQCYRSFAVHGPLLAGSGARSLLLSTWGSVRDHGMVIFETGDNEYHVTQVAERFDDDPQTFARLFDWPNMEAIASQLHPTKQPVTTALRGSERLTHRCLASLPDDVFILGDAAIAMNPVFGQGMTLALMGVAAVDAQLLRGQLSSRLHANQIRAAHRNAWWLGTAEDRLHTATGWRRRLLLWGERRLYARLRHLDRSPFHTAVFLQVVQMMKPVWWLLWLWLPLWWRR